ncbi:MAG: hypothetical protein KGZ81_07390 [Flavobacteriales bacterium]|nr:hypothetical protein [Flavobacteriales bacterium]
MTQVRFTANLKRNGVRFNIGDVVPVETEDALKELLALGVVEVVDGNAPVVTEPAVVETTPQAPEATTTEETVTPVPLDGQTPPSTSEVPTQPSEPNSDGEPSPEQIAQDIAQDVADI